MLSLLFFSKQKILYVQVGPGIPVVPVIPVIPVVAVVPLVSVIPVGPNITILFIDIPIIPWYP